ncbi:MAG TPA: hypothetical protein VHN14_17500 [Kofleriaceae bacterium]|nr:hypothetical protein [Kofleriaceae bacterium]
MGAVTAAVELDAALAARAAVVLATPRRPGHPARSRRSRGQLGWRREPVARTAVRLVARSSKVGARGARRT